MNRVWSKLGGQLGMGCIALGILIIGLAWNGAASIDFVQGQVPYLLSGGFLGLALVGVGVGLFVVQNARRDRSLLEAQVKELAAAVSRLANASAGGASNGRVDPLYRPDAVVVGRGSYHLADCRLVQGKSLPATTPAAAGAEGLTPCRICKPPVVAALES